MAREQTDETGLSRSERRKQGELAWERFVRRGELGPELRDEIALSWQRSRETYSIDPLASRPAEVMPEQALEERCRADEVLHIAAPILRDFSDRLCLTDHALAYFDGEGWMLSIEGDEEVVQRLAGISFCPGTNWAEQSAGTSGPGTALALAQPQEVFAAEHFVEAWQPWSCAAAPVMTPDRQTPAGLVDITGPWEVRRRQALVVVKAIARAIEERYRAAMNVRDEVVRYALQAARAPGEVLVAVDNRARVIAANDLATRRRLVEGARLPLPLREALCAALRSSSQGERELRAGCPDDLPLVVSPVRYEGVTVGAVVRSSGVTRPRAARPSAPCAHYDFSCIVGQSAALKRALDLAEAASRSDLPLVISGESGTGKELFAQAVHAGGARRAGPFVALNCGCIPSELLEAELFGYEAGTFTGARRDGKPGRFEDADGGTLFLDEVTELSASAQTALLRVLQEREVTRVGSSLPRAVDVRVVAATNTSLEQAVREKRFRHDLYYRLHVLCVVVPPLRDRGEDVLLLARHFLSEVHPPTDLTLAEDAVAALRAHPWPGNVRELRNAILRATATAQGRHIHAADLQLAPPELGEPVAPAVPASGGVLKQAVQEIERGALLAALESSGWNVAEAARQLGVSRMTLYRWTRRYGIQRPEGSR